MSLQRPSDVIPFQKPQDSFFSMLVTRRCSRIATFYLLRFFPTISPNAVSLLSFGVSVLGIAAFFHPSYSVRVVGVLLIQIGFVFDCSDGEISRITNQHSAFGAWLDSILDRFKELGMLAALTFIWYQTADNSYSVIIVGSAAIIGLQCVSYLREAKKSAWPNQRTSELFLTPRMYIGTVDVIIFLVSIAVLLHLEIVALIIFLIASIPMIARQIFSAYRLSRTR